jgi:hypothetical protein
MLRLSGGQVESLFDLGLPVEVRELPADLAALDGLLADPALLGPVERAWDQAARGRGRPTVPMTVFVRLMVVKQRSGWGYETLVREVSDSLHLRRFCRIALTERVPDESTVRKLVRRLGAEVVDDICRVVITRATTGERRFVARAARIDSTVIEADVRYPTDIGLAADATKALARAAATVVAPDAPRVRNRSRAIGRRQRKLMAARRLEELAERAGTVARQIRQRLAGETITNRLVSIADPDARPIRKGKLRAPTEFGSVVQLAELCENTRRGARGLIVPAASQIGSPNEPDLLPATAVELDRLNLRPREVALDGGFFPIGVAEDLPDPQRVFIAGRQSAGSRRTNRRLARFRVGIEGRISHLKRRYGLRRSRLKGHHGARTWTAWAILAYNLDTLAIRAA